MALRQTKKISELTALTSASLQTTLLGVDNGTTYKVTLDVLEDAIINMVSRSTDLRLDSLEAYTASAGAANDLSPLNSFTSSQSTLNSAFTTGINARLQTSSFNEFSTSVHSEILSATNEQSFNGLISGSSQFTASYDERYVLSGSITQTTWDNIANKPSGIVSQSTDLSSLNTFTQSIDNRVDSLESWSSSLTDTFATDLEVSIVSSSVAATIGIISQNTGLVSTSSFNSYTASITTASLVTSITNLNSFTASQYISNSYFATTGSNLFVGEQTISGSIIPAVSGAYDLGSVNNPWRHIYVNTGSIFLVKDARIVKVLNTDTIVTTTDIASGSVNISPTLPNGVISGSSQITSLGFVSGSYLTSLSGAISSSSQLTSSFDTRYAASGSVGSSVNTSSLATTGSNSFNGNQTITGSLIVSAVAVVNGGVNIPTGSTITLTSGSSISVDASGAITGSLTGSVFGIGDVVAFSSSVNSRLNSAGGVAGTISSSAQITAFGFVSGSYETTGRSIVSGSSQIVSLLPTGVISGSSQLTSSYDTRYTLSGSVSVVPSGTISGSAQITAFGFVSSSSAVPAGTISGSSQITGIVNLTNLSATSQVSASVFVGGFGVTDAKFTVIQSKAMTFWPNITYELVRFTTSGGVLIGRNGETNDYGLRMDVSGSTRFTGNMIITGSLLTSAGITGSIAATNGVVSGSSQLPTLATTGSNSFNGNQIITGSLTITTGSFVASQILANTASLYLTSGSNLYVQNNGVVEITGSLIVSGSTMFASAGGDEGGEIQLGVPTTNTTLSTRVVVDIWQNRFRIFDGNTKGVFVDLSKAPTGVGGELMHKTSGFVNTDVDVSLGNLKARIPASGNKSLQLSTISGTYSVYGSSTYSYNGIGGITLSSPLSITTTPTYISAGYNFTVAGATDTWILMDTSAGICWRVTMIIGPSYLNNFISIERLH